MLVLGAALGLWLVFAGGTADDSAQDDPDRLPIGDTDLESIAELAGITLPESTDGFLSARLDDDSQLDVTFTIDPADERVHRGIRAARTGGRPAGDHTLLPTLGPECGGDDPRRLRHHPGRRRRHSGGRAVEFTDEDGLTRVRLVLTASPQPR
ncbi:MAG: hypothetical protein R2789_18590 [Microthrixaceae bacterium]